MNPHADRTALRLKLYENGFEPLANRNKMCLVKGWSTLEVTPELIESKEWARSNRNLDTGVRCGSIVALDWDIDDKELLNKLLDEVVEKGVVAESPFVRVGRPPRELWVYRTREKIGKRTTGKFVPVTAEPDAEGYAVEILGKGCQFAGYGQRDARTEYQWPVESLLDHQYMDLPSITLAEVDALKAYAEAFFLANGLERRSPGGGTDTGGYEHVYDLEPDTVLDVKDVGKLTVAELTEALRATPDDVLRCSADAFRPSSGRNDSCMVSLAGDDLCVSDHGTYTAHFPVAAEAGASAHVLGQLLAERFPEHVIEDQPRLTDPEREERKSPFDPRDPLDANLQIALEHFVYTRRDNMVFDLADPRYGMTIDHFRTLMYKFYHEDTTAKGRRTVVRLADLWLQHPDRHDIDGIAMRPDKSFPLYRDGDTVHLNTYRTVDLPDTGDAAPGFEMLGNLLPIEAERRWFIQWLAHKVMNPAVRGPGVIMVAHETYGTGRGSLGKLIRSMFAEGLVQTIDFATVSGKTYQSQYNEWLADSLVVIVDEAQETAPQTSRWQTRSNAYEHLKNIIDPANHDMQVVRKGRANGPGKTHASLLIFTNHMDSVIVPPNDRRLGIVENGRTMPPEYWEKFHRWCADPANVGAFIAALKRTDMAGYNPYTAPPMTASKMEMVEAGESDLDRLLAGALAGLENTLICKEQIILRVEDLIVESDFDVPDEWRKMIERMLLHKTRRLPSTMPDRIRIDGKQRTVRAIGHPDPAIVQTVEGVIEEVKRNGAFQRSISSSTTVVQFPVRRS